MDQESKNQ